MPQALPQALPLEDEIRNLIRIMWRGVRASLQREQTAGSDLVRIRC